MGIKGNVGVWVSGKVGSLVSHTTSVSGSAKPVSAFLIHSTFVPPKRLQSWPISVRFGQAGVCLSDSFNSCFPQTSPIMAHVLGMQKLKQKTRGVCPGVGQHTALPSAVWS